MKKRIIWIFLFTLFCLGAFGALNSWHIKSLDEYVSAQIQQISKKQLPVEIQPGHVEIQILPFSMRIFDMKITPKAALAEQIKPFEIREIKLSPSFFHLFIGKLHLSYLNITGSKLDLTVNLNSDEKTDFHTNLEKYLRIIPISQIKLEDVDLNLALLQGETTYRFAGKDISTLITNDMTSLALKLKSPQLSGSQNKTVLFADTQLETHLFLTNKNLIISELKVKEGTSFLLSSGSTQHSLPKKNLKSASINLRAQIEAERLKFIYDLIKKDEETNPLAPLKGLIRTDLQVKAQGLDKFDVKINGNVQGLAYEKFKIGNVTATGTVDSTSKQLKVSAASLETPGIHAVVEDFNLDLNTFTFSEAKGELKKFELQSFLQYAINEKVPAIGHATGQLKCSGSFKNFNITCPATMAATQLKVNPDDKVLIQLAKLNGEGSIVINDKEVSFTTQLKTEKSSGSGKGVVNYKEGFAIEFKGDNVDLGEVKKISVVELGGTAQIAGTTQGNSRAATFELTLDGKNLELQKYKLGDASVNLSYKAGNLYAQRLQGTLVSSRYLGNVTINFPAETITGNVQFPFIDLAVAKEAIKANLAVPVDVSGSGSAVVNIDGPLKPEHLSFKAKARLYNCTFASQHFDNADVDIISTLGEVHFNSVQLEEKNSNIAISGSMNLDSRTLNILFKSQRFFLDDFYYAKLINAPAKGQFALDGKVGGKFDSPGVDGTFTSNTFTLSGQNMSPIKGDMQINATKKLVTVTGPNDLKFVYKDLKSSPDFIIEATSKELDIAPLMTSFIGLKTLDDYQILTSVNANVRINKNDTKLLNGYVFLPTLDMRFQKTNLKNSQDISLFFTNGKLNFAPFDLAGKNGKLGFKSLSNSVNPIDMQISGLFSLSFLHIFAPFLETIEGLASVNLRVRGNYQKLHFLGSSFIDDGFIKLPSIPHAVEEMKVDILFNQDQVIINSIKAKFASGQAIGDGKILFKDKKNMPTTINLHVDNMDLNLPEQVNTKGSADFQLSGSWLPFTLTGTYQVYDGLISKELGGGSDSNASPNQIFLPQVLREETTSPIQLDLTIIPQVPLKIKNSLVDGKIEGRIRVTGNPESPALGGNISLVKNSQIIFIDTVFKVRDSSFALNGSSPPNPGLYLVADARYRGYDIEMLVQGTAEKPRFKWASSPTLTEPEIISLLTLGTTSSSTQMANNPTASTNGTATTNNNLSGVGIQNSQQSGAAIFSQNPLSKELKNRFGFDIQFSSKFDTANSVAVPKISAAKQINEKTTLIGSYQTGRDARSDVSLRYQLSKDVAATMNVQSKRQEEANQQRGNTLQATDILGIDLEYRKEFK